MMVHVLLLSCATTAHVYLCHNGYTITPFENRRNNRYRNNRHIGYYDASLENYVITDATDIPKSATV